MIAGSNFRIRTVMHHDLADLLILLSDMSKQGDFLPFDMWSQPRLQEQFVRDGFWTETSRKLVIVDLEDNVIGLIWVFKSVPYLDALEIGYRLFDRERWGKGLMTEAVGLTIDFLLSWLQVNRLEIRSDVDNEASVKVAEKLGFKHEGIARKAVFSRGVHRDMHVFSLLREEWTFGNPAFANVAGEPNSS